VLLDEGDRQALDEPFVDVAGDDLGADRQAELRAEHLHHLIGGDVARRHQVVDQSTAVLGLLAARGLELRLGEIRRAQQQLAEVGSGRHPPLPFPIGLGGGFAAHGSGSSGGALTRIEEVRPWERCTAASIPFACSTVS
jgi:hypothetical protein